MKINLTDLFNGSESRQEIDCKVDLSDLEYSGYHPIKDGVSVKGAVYTRADVVHLELKLSFMFNGFCDRCAEETVKEFIVPVEKIVVSELQNEDDDSYILVENHSLDLDELVNEEVSLSLPGKFLCKEDCKGLCQKCGANLNVKKCDCKSDVDPRMEALLQLLDEE
ncbi:MAG: YceD family protein [Eubacterium sp.]